MQKFGYLVLNGSRFHVLVRSRKYGNMIKLRKGGQAGQFLEAESEHFEDYPDLVDRLLNGESISL